jgi:hypothetical protein
VSWEVDDKRAGEQYWVECAGGPYDGDMLQFERDPRGRPAHGFFVRGSHKHVPDGTIRRGGVQGHYILDGWANEELGIVRMTWRPDPPEEIVD